MPVSVCPKKLPPSHVADAFVHGPRCLRSGGVESHEISARAALIQLHDREVVLPRFLEPPRAWHQRRARATVQHEQDGIGAMEAAYRDPLHATEPGVQSEQRIETLWCTDDAPFADAAEY